MKLIGITGGIATGKSVVSRFVRSQGHPVIDADIVGHEVLETDLMRKKLAEKFGDILDPQGMVDRKKLGALVFSSREKLDELNRTVHPEMVRRILEQAKELSVVNNEIFVEAAVLFEMNLDRYVDFVIVTDCPDELRIKRMIYRDKLSAEEAAKRLAFQLPRDVFIGKADFVIDTSRGMEETFGEVSEMLHSKPWNAKI